MNPLRLVGHLLLWAGFLAGAFLAVRNVEVTDAPWTTVHWPSYALALLIGVVGVVILRVTNKQAVTHTDKLQSDIKVLEVSVKDLLAELGDFILKRDKTNVFEVHGLIDTRLMESISNFVESRHTLIHTYGLRQYAQLMTDFSIAERNINRAWSASADGYVDEVWLSLDRAESKLQAVATKLIEYRKELGGG